MTTCFETMKPGIRHRNSASCRVSVCTAIPNRMRLKTREITHVDVPENLRNMGMATQMLLDVCDEADLHKIILLLFPKPFGEGPMLDEQGLIDWYSKKFGFQVIQLSPVMMARMPFSTPGTFKTNYVASVTDRKMQ